MSFFSILEHRFQRLEKALPIQEFCRGLLFYQLTSSSCPEGSEYLTFLC